jgi:hypothetical protein
MQQCLNETIGNLLDYQTLLYIHSKRDALLYYNQSPTADSRYYCTCKPKNMQQRKACDFTRQRTGPECHNIT